jgi:exodeoxyribonuclease V alpha subunit
VSELLDATRDEPVGVTLTGTLLSITFRNEDNGYTVARLEPEDGGKPIAVVGPMPGVVEGDTLRLSGRWTRHPTYGRQVEVERCELRPPAGRRGLVRFLGGGRIKGVGPKTAERIVDTLGTDVLERLERNPGLLNTVPGLGRGKARLILAQLQEQRTAAAALVFLQEHGLGPGLSQRVWRAYGERTVEVVRDNPWRLAEEVWGVGFRTADLLARGLGHEPDSAQRIAAGLTHLLGRAAQEGHVGLPAELLVEQAAPFLEVDELPVREVLAACIEERRVLDDGLVYRPELLAAERALAARVRALLDPPAPLVTLAPAAAVVYAEQRSGLSLAPDQRRALELALGSRLAVITGGPGVGKTTIVRLLLDVLVSQGRRVALAAPTGRAARRLAQATGAEASTLHRLLGIQPAGAGFARPLAEPLDLDVLIVDETSMVDLALMAAAVSALPDEAGLILVGDADQLPSVGPGEVLAAFIDSGMVPVARLSTIFRQAEHGGIVRVAHDLNSGEVPAFDEGPGGEAFFVERNDAAAAAETIRALVVERIPRRFGLDPLRDVQVLTPLHGGPLGTVALNELLREALNPPAPGRPELSRFGRLFRLGDKVMQVRNNYDLAVFNGDIGVITALDPEEGSLTIDFEGRSVEYGLDALDQLEPAFAITCHKSQGSEFPAVVLPIVGAHSMMLRRNLVYTAFTRARRVLCAVGQWRALHAAVAAVGSGQRHSRLAERLRGEA